MRYNFYCAKINCRYEVKSYSWVRKEWKMKRIPDEKCASVCGLFCGACPSFPEECHGCLSDYVREGCRECKNGFRKCASNHTVARCCERIEFPCQKLEKFSKYPVINGICNHANVISDLKRMKDIGILSCLKEQVDEFTCPECGELISWFDRNSHVCSKQK